MTLRKVYGKNVVKVHDSCLSLYRGHPRVGRFNVNSRWGRALMSAEMTPYHPQEDFVSMVVHSHTIMKMEWKSGLNESVNRDLKDHPIRHLARGRLSQYLLEKYAPRYPELVVPLIANMEKMSYQRLIYYCKKYGRSRKLDNQVRK